MRMRSPHSPTSSTDHTANLTKQVSRALTLRKGNKTKGPPPNQRKQAMTNDRISHLLTDDETHPCPTLYLASRSPRRRELLAEAGIPVKIIDAGVDDSLLQPGNVSIEEWTVALAYFKARAGAIRLQADRKSGIVLGADTLVEYQGEIIGQPKNRQHARAIIQKLNNATHQVITGVALVDTETNQRSFICDSATVTVGEISPAALNTYLDSGLYQGKAGAYNLADRIAAGWPITYLGDPGTIMGLPLKRLIPYLAQHFQTHPNPSLTTTPDP